MNKNKYFGHFSDHGYELASPVGSLDIMKQSIMNVFTSRFNSAKEMSEEGFCNLYDCRKIFKRRYDLLTLDSLEEIYFNYSGIRFGKNLRRELSSKIDPRYIDRMLSLNGSVWDNYKIETTPLEKLVNIFIFQRVVIESKGMNSVSEELLLFLSNDEVKLLEVVTKVS